MKITRVDTTISTDKLIESKEFYMQHFNFELVYESDWYIELLAPDLSVGVSFTKPQRDSGDFFHGTGIIISFEVEDVDAEHQRLKEAGLTICQELVDKPWGERSFVVNDPSGVHIYIYKSIPPTSEYKAVYDSFKK
ncbi:MAG: Glyoxalase/Bleomycin resistance protein/Dioxygenase superfamily protein [Firmicutes bacterium]|nr:Glyoxalase/Bleomycin resistance protein/Dioxygenase superfamily protein [Bacillota bacterium]